MSTTQSLPDPAGTFEYLDTNRSRALVAVWVQ